MSNQVLQAQITPHERVKPYPSGSYPLDLTTVVPRRKYARLVKARSAGTLALKFQDGGEETFTIAEADLRTDDANFPGFIIEILGTTTIDVRVYF